jgi:hypothetical protein
VNPVSFLPLSPLLLMDLPFRSRDEQHSTVRRASLPPYHPRNGGLPGLKTDRAGTNGSMRTSLPRAHDGGTCLRKATPQNAVIVSAPHASFVERWKASYETFNEDEWAQHSVDEPWVSVDNPLLLSARLSLTSQTGFRISPGHCSPLPLRNPGAFHPSVLLANVAWKRGREGP